MTARTGMAFCTWLSQFRRSRRAAAVTEFALVGLWAIGLMLVIFNLALLSFSLGSLAHGVQAAARQASVVAASTSSSTTDSSNAITQTFSSCPLSSDIAGYFNNYAHFGLPPAGNTPDSNPSISASWHYTSGSSLGLYVVVSGSYIWRPIGFNLLSSDGITLKISTVATVPGTISFDTTSYNVSVSGQC